MAEKKFTISTKTPTQDALPGSTGTFFVSSLWTEPTQGTDRNSRIGNKIQTTWLSWKGWFENRTTSTSSDYAAMRVIVVIFTWKIEPPDPLTTVVINDLLVNDGVVSTNVTHQFMLPFDRDKISVLKSWRFTLGSKEITAPVSNLSGPSNINLSYSKAFKRKMVWENNDAQLITKKSEPHIAVIFTGSIISSSTMTLNNAWSAKLNYIDI